MAKIWTAVKAGFIVSYSVKELVWNSYKYAGSDNILIILKRKEIAYFERLELTA